VFRNHTGNRAGARAAWRSGLAVAGLVGVFAAGCGGSDEGSGDALTKAAQRAAKDASQAVQDMEADARDSAAAQLGRGVEDAAKRAADDVATRGVEATAEAAGRTLEGNVERSVEVGKETYEGDRDQGEGVVESAGDAYNAVLDETRKKDEDAE